MTNEFYNADKVFRYYYGYINRKGIDFNGTKAIFNEGFTILNPTDRIITEPKRNFNAEYAEAEWQWYLSGDPSVKKLGEINGSIPPIWKTMTDNKGCVNSNYGYQWKRENQLDKVVKILKDNPETRQAVISIYDGKEIDTYANDTPCTYAINFTILAGKLNMAALMRSNDLWFGFCNDQYCFSKLQELVANRLKIEVGTYYHNATNFHIYNNKLNLDI